MTKVTFSSHYEAVKSRIRRLPKLLAAEVENLSWADAVHLIALFKDGIRRRKYFQLKELKPRTIADKKRAGYSDPQNPLFAESRKRDRFNNMMEIVREKTRFIVRPKQKNHFKAKIPLSVLFDVHEYGATIQGMAWGHPCTIRIPPRPAFRYAYNVLMTEKQRQDPAAKLREKITKYINTGEWKATERMVLKDDNEVQDFKKPQGFPE